MFSIFLDTGSNTPWMPPERPPWWEMLVNSVIDFIIIARVFIGETILYFSPGLLLGLLYAYSNAGSFLLCGSVGAFISLFVIVGIEESLLTWQRYRARTKRAK